MTGRNVAKALAFGIATIVVTPSLCSFWIRGRLLGVDRALEGSTQSLSLVPGVLGQYIRRAFLARALASFHRSGTVEFGTIFSRAGARIDEGAYVGPRCHLGLVHSGPATHGTADLSTPIRDQHGTQRMVTIGAGSWIGSGAIVLEDVGRESIVGAGSVVTRTVPDRVVAAGVPARVLRDRVPLDQMA